MCHPYVLILAEIRGWVYGNSALAWKLFYKSKTILTLNIYFENFPGGPLAKTPCSPMQEAQVQSLAK